MTTPSLPVGRRLEMLLHPHQGKELEEDTVANRRGSFKADLLPWCGWPHVFHLQASPSMILGPAFPPGTPSKDVKVR